MTKIIGLTGGIGSGKSTVANYLYSKGIPVYVADREAKKISNSAKVAAKIKAVFGESVFDGMVLDRKKMAAIVFTDKEKLNQLNQIIHPEVAKDFKKWVKKHQQYKYVVKEVAILFETGGEKKCDLVILVTAPIEIRIKRVMQRDNVDRESVMQRMNNQMPEEEKIKKSDFVVENIELEATYQQVDELLKKIK